MSMGLAGTLGSVRRRITVGLFVALGAASAFVIPMAAASPTAAPLRRAVAVDQPVAAAVPAAIPATDAAVAAQAWKRAWRE